MILSGSVWSVVMPPSFPEPVICGSSHSQLFWLKETLKNKLLVSLLLLFCFLRPILSIAQFVFITPFLLFSLSVTCSSDSSLFRWKLWSLPLPETV